MRKYAPYGEQDCDVTNMCGSFVEFVDRPDLLFLHLETCSNKAKQAMRAACPGEEQICLRDAGKTHSSTYSTC